MKVTVLVTHLCLTLCDPVDGSPPGSSVHGILQARILKWVVIPFSGGSSHLGIEPWSPALQADSLPSEPPEDSIVLLPSRGQAETCPQWTVNSNNLILSVKNCH